MRDHTNPSRRAVIKTGAFTLAAAVRGDAAFTAPKAPGETKVIYFGGDYIHNGVGQERYLRQTFSKTGWRMLFAQASRFITPEALADTDLFMMTRTGAYDAQGFSPEGLVEDRPDPDPFLSQEMERAIIDNVTNRGMGLIAFHCTAGNPEHPDFMKFLGVKPFRTGARLQPVRCHNFNREHPITAGFSEFEIGLDENLKKKSTMIAQRFCLKQQVLMMDQPLMADGFSNGAGDVLRCYSPVIQTIPGNIRNIVSFTGAQHIGR